MITDPMSVKYGPSTIEPLINPVFDYPEWKEVMKANKKEYDWKKLTPEEEEFGHLGAPEEPYGYQVPQPQAVPVPIEDKKYDRGKPMVSLMKKDFAKALMAVAEVTSYGVKRYNSPGSWRKVTDAYSRYEDALGRHDLAVHKGEAVDDESKLLHAAHRAWNALATLELILEGKN